MKCQEMFLPVGLISSAQSSQEGDYANVSLHWIVIIVVVALIVIFTCIAVYSVCSRWYVLPPLSFIARLPLFYRKITYSHLSLLSQDYVLPHLSFITRLRTPTSLFYRKITYSHISLLSRDYVLPHLSFIARLRTPTSLFYHEIT